MSGTPDCPAAQLLPLEHRRGCSALHPGQRGARGHAALSWTGGVQLHPTRHAGAVVALSWARIQNGNTKAHRGVSKPSSAGNLLLLLTTCVWLPLSLRAGLRAEACWGLGSAPRGGPG